MAVGNCVADLRECGDERVFVVRLGERAGRPADLGERSIVSGVRQDRSAGSPTFARIEVGSIEPVGPCPAVNEPIGTDAASSSVRRARC